MDFGGKKGIFSKNVCRSVCFIQYVLFVPFLVFLFDNFECDLGTLSCLFDKQNSGTESEAKMDSNESIEVILWYIEQRSKKN